MSIYQHKKYWKTGLSLFAILLFIASWWYTNDLVKHISDRERTRVEAWAKEIQSKAQLVSYTDELFKRISIEERKKGELWAKGVRKLISTDDPNADYDFLFEVVRNNETVPVILTDENDKITNYRNLEFEGEKPTPSYLKKELQFMKKHFTPLIIKLPNGRRNYLYYKDSKIFSDLKLRDTGTYTEDDLKDAQTAPAVKDFLNEIFKTIQQMSGGLYDLITFQEPYGDPLKSELQIINKRKAYDGGAEDSPVIFQVIGEKSIIRDMSLSTEFNAKLQAAASTAARGGGQSTDVPAKLFTSL